MKMKTNVFILLLALNFGIFKQLLKYLGIPNALSADQSSDDFY